MSMEDTQLHILFSQNLHTIFQCTHHYFNWQGHSKPCLPFSLKRNMLYWLNGIKPAKPDETINAALNDLTPEFDAQISDLVICH